MKLTRFALAFSVGGISPWLLPQLPPLWTLFAALALLLLLAVVLRQGGVMILLFLGFCHGFHVATETRDHQVPNIPQGLDARVTGRVVDLPLVEPGRSRFLLQVEKFRPLNAEARIPTPRLLRLSWYGAQQALVPGQVWTLDVRLRRPRGLANPGQFDYRQWLLSFGIDATGYVRDSMGLQGERGSRIDRWRWQLRQRVLSRENLHNPGLILALGIGDRSFVDAEQWRKFASLGVIHLMVISGLHVGFAAMLGFWAGSWLLRPLILLRPTLCARDLGWLGALLTAAIYALCAGLSTPTLRALLMLMLVAVSRLLRLRISIWTLLALAFALVILVSPLAVISTGLWMSFGAVVVLVAAFQGRAATGWFSGLVRAQLALFLGFSALLLALGNPVPLAAPLVNLVAVPLVGSLVVPLVFLGLVLGWLPGVQAGCWLAADQLLSLLDNGMDRMMQLDWPRIYPLVDSGLQSAAMLGAGLLLVLLPMALRLWPLLLLAFTPLFAPPRPDPGLLTLHLFDVGQGSAVLLQQRDYQLVYDSGPAFSESFNAGRDILLPWLEANPTRERDLVISHGDNDHAGGVPPLIEGGVITGAVYAGEPEKLAVRAQACRTGLSWTRGEVQYSFLYPPGGEALSADNNDRSCVLLISFGGRHILLPGDISRTAELALLRSGLLPEDVELLLVPHHGSNTSSSTVFVNQLAPDFALVSAGYGNAFGHPTAEVLARYQRAGSRVRNTAVSGALQLSWETASDEPDIRTEREQYRLWWQE